MPNPGDADADTLTRERAGTAARREVRAASDPGAAPATLARLARDERVIVRVAVAMNPATPPTLDAALAQDADERVRAVLARKLASMAPGLSTVQRESWQEQAHRTLSLLAQDAAIRVRAAITEAISQMPDAPRALILALAHDAALPVSEPVIRLSPLLTTADLIALLHSPPHAQAGVAVANRHGLDADVADTIARGPDDAAIGALLANHSAAIREATLDALTARCAAAPQRHQDWQEALVRRPELSEPAMRALSEFVAADLLDALVRRGGVSPSLLATLQARLEERLHAAPASKNAPPSLEQAIQRAQAMQSVGRLDEAAVLKAARSGDERACMAMLAVCAGVAGAVVERAATLRSAKGLLSLIWAAGLSMRLAVPLQILVGKLPPHAVLRATGSGDFPLAEAEMQWQLTLLKQMGG